MLLYLKGCNPEFLLVAISFVNPSFTLLTLVPFNIAVVRVFPNNLPVNVILPAAVSPVSLLKNCVESKVSNVEALELDTGEIQLNPPEPFDAKYCPLVPSPDTVNSSAPTSLSAIVAAST